MGGIMAFLDKIFQNGIGELITGVGDTIDKFVTTDEDKQKAMLAKQEFELKLKKFQMDAEQAIYKDRQSARNMYMKDSSLQKIAAIMFLVGYFGITGFMLYFLFSNIFDLGTLEIPAWGVSLISTIFGAMSAKVNTIVDFLFGGSQGERDNSREINKAFKKGVDKG